MPEILSERKRKGFGYVGKWYSPLTNEIYSYQNSYERNMMGYLDENKIKWIRCKERFPYFYEGKKHTYNPDLYLPDFDMYLELKGFLRKKDPIKFEQFPQDKNLVLLEYEDLVKLGLKVFSPSNEKVAKENIDKTKWPYNIISTIDDYSEAGELSDELRKKVSSQKFFDIIK